MSRQTTPQEYGLPDGWTVPQALTDLEAADGIVHYAQWHDEHDQLRWTLRVIWQPDRRAYYWQLTPADTVRPTTGSELYDTPRGAKNAALTHAGLS